VRTRVGIAAALVVSASFLLFGVGTAGAKVQTSSGFIRSIQDFTSQLALGPASHPGSDVHFGVGISECPHAGEPSDKNPKPLDRRQPDKVEQLSNGGDDVKVNQDYACMPQNETSIAVNPLNAKNVVAGQNDYRLGWGSTGFDASTDNGNHWYDGVKTFPTAGTPLANPVILADDHIDGGGDPAIVFDRDGVVYEAEIHFERERDDNGIFVGRSTNGGFTWNRPCVIRVRDFAGRRPSCGAHDPRTPGDGVVVFDEDPDGTGPAPAFAFHDKEYIAAGPRPLTPDPSDPPGTRVGPDCFEFTTDPSTGLLPSVSDIFGASRGQFPKTRVPCDPAVVGSDRIYVTWTRFDSVLLEATVFLSYSDDRARSWSPPRKISGDDSVCQVPTSLPERCTQNQFSSPTVNPTTGFLYVGFENFNTLEENQYLLVRSHDGGQTFEGPFFATFVFDINYPNAGGNRSGDCGPRGAQPRNVLTNSCFRMFSAANVVVDKRGIPANCNLAAGFTPPVLDPDAPTPPPCADLAFADDLYMVLSDNRNGTQESSNTDVFFFKSTDGGMTWIGPTRVNDDPSRQPIDRDCTDPDDPDCNANFGNDNFYPWVDVSTKGDINIGFHDRRLDTQSTLHEWPTSRSRPGNYLAWFWGAICTTTTTAEVTADPVPTGARQCLAPAAEVIEPPDFGETGPEPAPGGGPAFLGPFKNFTVSDVPSNLDYTFRAGIFMGDYNNVAVGPDGTAYAFWTDGRNGRSSRNQTGRNPACEQGDVFADSYSSNSGGTAKQPPSLDVINAFSVTPCPTDMKDVSP
jgi:hypothetical protein